MWAGWIAGLIGLGLFFGLCWWLVRQGKKIAQGEEAAARAQTLEKQQRAIMTWQQKAGILDAEGNEIKRSIRANPSLGNVVGGLRRAHGSAKVRSPRKPGAF